MNNPAPMMGYSGMAGQQNVGQSAMPSVMGTPGTIPQQLHMQQAHTQNGQTAAGQQVQQLPPPGLVSSDQTLSGMVNGGNVGATLAASNAGNPLYHPHQGDPAMLNNPIWKLQLQLAAVSRQSLGRANVYARQSAMRKYLLNKTQGASSGGTLNEMSASLVDHTKQLLLDMAGESPLGNNNASSSAVSTPITPNAELSNGHPTTPSVLLQHKKLSQYNIDEDDEIEHRMVGPKDAKHDDQLWHALDLSNLQVFNLTESLFRYEFLTRLYLNGNNLTVLPKAVKS